MHAFAPLLISVEAQQSMTRLECDRSTGWEARLLVTHESSRGRNRESSSTVHEASRQVILSEGKEQTPLKRTRLLRAA